MEDQPARLGGPLVPLNVSRPTTFFVGEAVAADREAIRWSDYRIGTRTPPMFDRCTWIALVDQARLVGSSYAKWADYLTVQDDLGCGGEMGRSQRLGRRASDAVSRWVEDAATTAKHPMKARIDLACETMGLLTRGRKEPNTWPEARDQLRALLAGSSDHEWVAYLVRFAGWGDVPEVTPKPGWTGADVRAALSEQQRLAREAPARWGYPWFLLPPDQRPGGAAAKPEP